MIREETIAVLRAVKQHGPVTLRQLDNMRVHRAQSGCKAALHQLQREHQLIEVWDHVGDRASYITTSKGDALLAKLDRPKAPMGEIAPSRQPEPFKPLVVKPCKPVRQGADAHELCPSLRNGREEPFARPFSMSGRVEVVGMWRA